MSLKVVLGNPVAYHRALVGVCGSVTAALMLSQALYWTERTGDPEGWFHKTCEEWEAETGLTRREQETARAKLRDSGVWFEDRKARNGRRRYRVDLAHLTAALRDLECRNAPIYNGGNRQSDLYKGTETTAESTAERGRERSAPGSGHAPTPAPLEGLPGSSLIAAKQFHHQHRAFFRRVLGRPGGKQLAFIHEQLAEFLADGETLDEELLREAERDTREFRNQPQGTFPPEPFFSGLAKALAARAKLHSNLRTPSAPPSTRPPVPRSLSGFLSTDPPAGYSGFGPYPEEWASERRARIVECWGSLQMGQQWREPYQESAANV